MVSGPHAVLFGTEPLFRDHPKGEFPQVGRTLLTVFRSRAQQRRPHPTSWGAASAVCNECRQASVTVMLPRVAFEYGHTWWAFSTSARAVAASTFGMSA